MKHLKLTIQKEFRPLATAPPLAVAAVYAQTSRGTVTGTVLDSTGPATHRRTDDSDRRGHRRSALHALMKPESTGSMEN